MLVQLNQSYSVGALLLSVLSAILVGIFALRLDPDPDHCLSTPLQNISLPYQSYQQPQQQNLTRNITISQLNKTTDPDLVDIGNSMRLGFEILFYTYVAQICLGTVTYMVSQNKIIRSVILLSHFLTTAVWVYLINLRFTHQGKVCAGDFLPHEYQSDESSRYLIWQGIVLNYLFYAIITILVLTGCAVVVGICKSRAKSEEQTELV